jgi:hypothetical protein
VFSDSLGCIENTMDARRYKLRSDSTLSLITCILEVLKYMMKGIASRRGCYFRCIAIMEGNFF